MNENTTKFIWVGILIAVIIATGAYFFPKTQIVSTDAEMLGAGTRFPNGISADRTSPIAGQVRGTTLLTTGASTFGGTGTFTTTNTATSTVVVGCIQTTATSTASPVRLVFSSIATSSPTFNPSNTIGLVGWQFGTCPI